MKIKTTQDFIARLMEIKGFKRQKDLGAALGYKEDVISKYANGKRQVKLPTAIRWLEDLNIDPAEFFNPSQRR